MFKYILNKKNLSSLYYLAYLIFIIILVDIFVFHGLLGFGYPRHYEQENIQRFPKPYVEFTGKPNVENHNEYGFRGDSFNKAKANDLKIAFFGGSTGYAGDPPIAKIIEKELTRLLGKNVFVANYSVVSSNHRQHLHAIIEFLPEFKPDIIIFYGGYNETIQSGYYDPRPGYPYNFFYRAETKPFLKLLLENSALIGEIDKKTGYFTGLAKLRAEEKPFLPAWNNRIVSKYFETLLLAKKTSQVLESKVYNHTKFFAFYQPFQLPDNFIVAHNEIKRKIKKSDYIFDVSSEYESLGKQVYLDIVHVNQNANEVMGKRIAYLISAKIRY
jgi:hypothetical protein